MLGELEQLVILGVLHAGKDAYGVPVHDEIQRRAARDLTLGTIYKTLTRLEEKGIVASRIGEPTAERGGRRTKCYSVTPAGRRKSNRRPDWRFRHTRCGARSPPFCPPVYGDSTAPPAWRPELTL